MFRCCFYVVPMLFQWRSDVVLILFLMCSNSVQMLFRCCSECVPQLFQLRSKPVPTTLFRRCSNCVPIWFRLLFRFSFRFDSDFVSILFRCCPTFSADVPMLRVCSNVVPLLFRCWSDFRCCSDVVPMFKRFCSVSPPPLPLTSLSPAGWSYRYPIRNNPCPLCWNEVHPTASASLVGFSG